MASIKEFLKEVLVKHQRDYLLISAFITLFNLLVFPVAQWAPFDAETVHLVGQEPDTKFRLFSDEVDGGVATLIFAILTFAVAIYNYLKTKNGEPAQKVVLIAYGVFALMATTYMFNLTHSPLTLTGWALIALLLTLIGLLSIIYPFIAKFLNKHLDNGNTAA